MSVEGNLAVRVVDAEDAVKLPVGVVPVYLDIVVRTMLVFEQGDETPCLHRHFLGDGQLSLKVDSGGNPSELVVVENALEIDAFGLQVCGE